MNRRSIIIGGVLSLLLFSCQKEPDLYQSIRDMNELQLMEFSLTKTVTIRDNYDEDSENEDSGWFSSIKRLANAAEKRLKKGNRVGVYGISKDYKVYIDLSKLNPEDIVIDGDNITLYIPDVTISSLGDNMVPEVYHERVSAWRSDISIEEREDMMRRGSKILETEFKNSPDSIYTNIKEQARQKASNWFTVILKDWGYNRIVIKTK